MAASLTKPLLQDWYLKRWKYSRRGVGPDVYADWVIGFVEAFLTSSNPQFDQDVTVLEPIQKVGRLS